jgi:S-adenosyl-L-methionine hydrolase (adenosine-forming)
VVRAGDRELDAEVLTVDRFGNVQLAAGTAEYTRLGGAGAVTVNGVPARLGGTFGDVPRGELVVLIDSARRLAVAANGGSAAVVLDAAPGDLVRIRLLGADD